MWLPQVYRLGSRDVGDHIIFWKSHSWIWTQWRLVAKPWPFPGFPLPLLLLLSHLPLRSSSYQDKELTSRRKVPILKAGSPGSWSWNLYIRPTPAQVPLTLCASFVTVSLFLGSLSFMVFHHQIGPSYQLGRIIVCTISNIYCIIHKK